MLRQSSAPGQPGSPARWTSSQKSGVGTSTTNDSQVWYTTSHGIIDEVYFPTVDTPNTRDLQFIVISEDGHFCEEKRDCTTVTKNIAPGVAGYIIENTCKKNQFKIKKTVFTNPYNNTLIQNIEFIPLVKKQFRLFVLLAPHLNGKGDKNNGFVKTYKGHTFLTANSEPNHLSLGTNYGFLATSCGYVGKSDGWTELKKYGYLKNQYNQAKAGNIALIGEIDLETSKNKFILVLSFGHTFEDSAKTATATLFHNNKHLLKKFVEGWQEIIIKKPKISFFNSKIKALFESSMMVLNTHLGKSTPGSVIASLSIPWGSQKTDSDLGGYHLIWPRDLVEISGGFIAAGDSEKARLILHFLASVQEHDGHFAQCLWHSGKPYWNNIQMDETALPILLAGILKQKKALKWLDPWPLVRRGCEYLVKHGPVTLQDRWEEDGGYTPFTLACEISALLVGADFYQEKGLTKQAKYLREIADYWNENIERWTYATDTKLCKKYNVDGYYVRITPDDLNPNKTNEIVEVKNRPPDHSFKPASEIIATDALALVRFGLRSANDPRVINTVKVIDNLLKNETKSGPVWTRYNEDGYGEHDDGEPFNGTGIGRGWPLLVGERAHYEIAKGNFKGAKDLLNTMVEQSGENYLIPEQIWDSKDIPAKFLFNGKPTLGAMPLVWAHAELLKLVQSLNHKKIYDCPTQTFNRYVKKNTRSNLAVWKPNHKIKVIDVKNQLRIEVFEDCQIELKNSDKKIIKQMEDSSLGVFYINVPKDLYKDSKEIKFSFKKHTKYKKKSFVIKINTK